MQFTDLKVWQRSHSLALDVYRLSAEYLLMLARDLSYLDIDTAKPLLSECDRISRMLRTLDDRVTAAS